MTREEAIKELQFVRNALTNSTKIAKAYDMAIKALEQEPKTAELRTVIEEVLRNIDGDDDYSIGQRNTLRWMLWCIDEGDEPEYEEISQPKIGRWIATEDGLECSECGCISKSRANFCQYCETKMVNSKENEVEK